MIDVGGHVIAPGFIDIHSHCDFILPLPDQGDFLEPFVRQGITTLVIGNCGYAPAPINPATAPLMQAYTAFIKPRDLEWNWRTFGEYLDYLEQHGVFMNTVPLAAHGALRIAVMGFEARAPNDEELAQMQRHLHECMESGAYGVSCGLIYAPGMFASTDELAALAEGLPAYDGIFAFHIRGSSETLVQAAQEVVEVARRGGVRVQHSHLEAFGKGHWGKVEETLALHEQVRGQGVDHGFDVIPYVAANTTFLAVLPPWSLDGGVEQLLERLRDPGTRARIKHDVEHLIPDWPTWRSGSWPHNLVEATGWDNVWIMWVESERNKQFEGKSVARLAEETGKDPFDVAADLILDEQGHVTALYLGVSGDLDEEWALRQILQHPNACIETDAFSLGRGKPHPALHGAFPRVLGQYVREEGLISLEDAVRRMTSLSAERYHLEDRGLVREGYWADLTVFDPETVFDRATYLEPEATPAGIDLVVINGAVVAEDGRVATDTRAGRVVRGDRRREEVTVSAQRLSSRISVVASAPAGCLRRSSRPLGSATARRLRRGPNGCQLFEATSAAGGSSSRNVSSRRSATATTAASSAFSAVRRSRRSPRTSRPRRPQKVCAASSSSSAEGTKPTTRGSTSREDRPDPGDRSRLRALLDGYVRRACRAQGRNRRGGHPPPWPYRMSLEAGNGKLENRFCAEQLPTVCVSGIDGVHLMMPPTGATPMPVSSSSWRTPT